MTSVHACHAGTFFYKVHYLMFSKLQTDECRRVRTTGQKFQNCGMSWPYLEPPKVIHWNEYKQQRYLFIGSLICEIDVKISEMWTSKHCSVKPTTDSVLSVKHRPYNVNECEPEPTWQELV